MEKPVQTVDAAEIVYKQLQKRGLTVDYADEGRAALRVTTPHGKPAQPTTISLLPIQGQGLVEARACASFAEGVASALLAPKQVAMQELAFETGAERLLMRLEGPLFLEGIKAAGGDPPLSQPWFDGLHIVYWLDLDLDRGPRVLSQKRFQAWNVSLDQVHCGARSLLFYRSRDTRFEPLDGFDGVELLRTGDGFEAGRVLVLEEIDWTRAAGGLRCAVPNMNTLLIQTLQGPHEVFQDAVKAMFDGSDLPLSKHTYVQRGSRLSGD